MDKSLLVSFLIINLVDFTYNKVVNINLYCYFHQNCKRCVGRPVSNIIICIEWIQIICEAD